METISTGMKWAIGVLLTLFIIAAGIGVYFVANGYFSRAQEQTVSQSQVLNSAEYSIYENRDVAGQEVINASTRYQGRPQFSVMIKTGINKSGFYAKNNYGTCFVTPSSSSTPIDVANASCGGGQVTVQNMQDVQNSANYVNPTGIFAAKVFRDANNEVRLIEFEQK